MPNESDFERAWLAKLSQCLDELAGEEIRKEVMAGSERLSAHSNREQVIAWSQRAMEKLDSLVDDAASDADGDGYTNYEEYTIGTSPADASDHPVSPEAVKSIPADGQENVAADASIAALISSASSGQVDSSKVCGSLGCVVSAKTPAIPWSISLPIS